MPAVKKKKLKDSLKSKDSQRLLQKPTPGSKKRRIDSCQNVKAEEDLAALKTRLAALERENNQLKQHQGGVKATGDSCMAKTENYPEKKKKKAKLDKSEAGDGCIEGGAASAGPLDEEKRRKKALIKEKKRSEMVAKREARKQRKAEARAAREQDGAQKRQLQGEDEERRLVDVSAWKPFSLHPSLERALSILVGAMVCLGGIMHGRLDGFW